MGTAGHVDHGKTTLVAQLTGIETDRLREEKVRGISIELGFAWLDLAADQRVAIIDVPGHERFVRQMIAGAAGIDLVNMRLSGVYGPMYASMRNLPSRLVHAAVHGTAPDFSPAFGGVPYADDAQDLTFVKDIARGIVLVHNADTLAHRTYNIGSDRATSNAEFLHAVKQVKPSFSADLEPGQGPRYKPNAYDDITRIQSEVGYVPAFTAQTAIAAYIAWLEAGNAQ